MNNQLIKTENNQEELKKNVQLSTRHLLNSIQKGDALSIAGISRHYMEQGMVSYEKLLQIPLFDRIPNLTHVYGLEKLHGLITVLLTAFCESMNVIRPMDHQQIVQCAYELLLTTEEDQLSVQDLVMFFKGAREGKYGKILDRLDQQTIFELLESYRQKRHEEFQRYKESKHLELKAMGPGERTTAKNEMEESFYNMAGRLNELKEKLKSQREVNRMQKYQKDL